MLEFPRFYGLYFLEISHPHRIFRSHFPMQAAAQRLLDEPALAQRVASTSAAGEFIAQVAQGDLGAQKGWEFFP